MEHTLNYTGYNAAEWEDCYQIPDVHLSEFAAGSLQFYLRTQRKITSNAYTVDKKIQFTMRATETEPTSIAAIHLCPLYEGTNMVEICALHVLPMWL
ncbi:hypothetical protein MAR_021199 [Mya arenaria]|uniref:Uncharacterized protein n=1 Tax=Mya arenaria TaxID=6604 RepID=A0ABY7EA14_MYAAR|nr:hypothetical protein MAR_021199 [Mya arenaria]